MGADAWLMILGIVVAGACTITLLVARREARKHGWRLRDLI